MAAGLAPDAPRAGGRGQRPGRRRVLGACLCAAALLRPAAGANLNPLEKTIELLGQLQSRVVADGEGEDAAYAKYEKWCGDTSKEKQREVETSTKQKAKLEAEVQLAVSDIEASTAKIDELSALISQNEAKTKEITAARKDESDVFKASEKELMQAIDMLGRAIEVLQKELNKATGASGSALLQTTIDTESLEEVLLGLGAVIDAAGSPMGDSAKQLFSLLEAREDGLEAAGDAGAPAAEAYQSSSGGIISIMEDMREKAETQLRSSRDAEAKAQHNFDLLRQSLKQQTENADTDMKDEKSDKASAEESRAKSEGDLAVTTKELGSARESLRSTQSTCIRTGADHEATLAGRKQELEILATAKKTIQSSMVGNAASFVQTGMTTERRKHHKHHDSSIGHRVVSMVKQLAAKDQSSALAQLASRISTTVRYGAGDGVDPFVKVKGLIQDMIRKLSDEASAESQEKAYCDDQTKKTSAQQQDLQDKTEGLKGKIDQAASASAELKRQVKELQTELSELAHQQAAMDSSRVSSRESFETVKANLQTGLTGIRSAIRILREYYASDDGSGDASLLQTDEAEGDGEEDVQPAPPKKFQKSSSTGDTIVGLLEVVESDLAKSLAEEETEETGKDLEYKKVTEENKVNGAMKEQDVKYKTREYKGLDKAITDLSSDFDSTSEELDAVKEYFGKLQDRCVAKPEPFAERQKRRQEEVQGLKEALSILEGQNGGSGSFLQKRAVSS